MARALGTVVKDHSKLSFGRFPYEIQGMIFKWASGTQVICVDFDQSSYNVAAPPQFSAMPYICRLSREIFIKNRHLLRTRRNLDDRHPPRVWADPDKDIFFLRILLGWTSHPFNHKFNVDAWMMKHLAVPYARFDWENCGRVPFESYMRNTVYLCPRIKSLSILCHDPTPGTGLTELSGSDRVMESSEPDETWNVVKDRVTEAFLWTPKHHIEVYGYRMHVDDLCFGVSRDYIFPSEPSEPFMPWDCGHLYAI